MIEQADKVQHDAIRKIVREVLRSELIDYLQTSIVRPDQIVTANAGGENVPAGYYLRVGTDGVARFLP